ncbi:MAG: cytidine/deoxycytidylate deaminase family protein [Christensenellaceae bacterium]|nr:cytidine/deoxycytidylate deaminase family protein [Christensenellaceae bacterium]
MAFDKWDLRFIEMTRTIAGWASCFKPDRKMGAVIVRDKRILTTGYNGAPQGILPCVERGECLRVKLGIPSGTRAELCYAVHAEQNALVQAARMGVSVFGATLYVSYSPCAICAKLIINAGISRVVYERDYPDGFSRELLEEAGVLLEKYEEAQKV